MEHHDTRTAWWKDAVVYQIYPRSFRDSDGDGVGDIRGIIEKLDYLQDLGVTVVWLSPVYPSPQDDNGYDVSDYRGIDPQFGTLADWDELAAGLHARGMRIVMDLVVNHSSDEHRWFQSSRARRDSPYRDFYVWREGRGEGPPNNWAAIFGGGAWERDAATGDWYLHLFSKKQPDLNWENPGLRAAVYDTMRWWLDRGVDGFRMDVINAISKDQRFPDGDNPEGLQHVFAPRYFMPGPRLLEFYGEMKREVLSHYDVMTVGEAALGSADFAAAVTDAGSGFFSMIIAFEHVDVDMERHGFATKWHRLPFAPGRLVDVLSHWQEALADRGWNCLYLNNHDQPRAVSRFAPDPRYRREGATMLATALHLLKGTPFVYQGEEIGMTNAPFAALSDYRDLESIAAFSELTENQGFSVAEALEKIAFRSRDNARTPMQWDASPGAGFTAGAPWIAVNPNHAQVNVAAERADPHSVLNHYRRLIALRKAEPVIVDGRYARVAADPRLWAYTRQRGDERLFVVCNFSTDRVPCPTPAGARFGGRLIGNYPEGDAAADLGPYEARVHRLA
ncbi:alpha-glucosidase [Lichenibacterium dinghuense]|uniref:alpha-glucosidase n=1 Tax=Lichenibacterium dinghuense TaxID=2895977 RepID=UPI001F421C81|nr:alpha-glucosidase [Lichenibacterium sp. 6Y81]